MTDPLKQAVESCSEFEEAEPFYFDEELSRRREEEKKLWKRFNNF